MFPGWFAKQSLPEIDDPSVVQRRNEVLDLEPVGGAVPDADTPAFMTAQERQQELHALAADSPDQRTLEAAAVAICRTALHESEPMQEQKIHAESTGSDDIPF